MMIKAIKKVNINKTLWLMVKTNSEYKMDRTTYDLVN